MTAPPLDPPTLRALGRRWGFDWTDAELEALRPALERALAVLAGLDRLDPGPADPATQYRIEGGPDPC